MIKIYTNTITGKHYDANGDLFADDMPRMFYKGTEKISWQLCTATPEIVENSGNTPDSYWTKSTEYAQYQAVGAFLTADDDYVKRMAGMLSAAVSAGNVSTISATVPEADFDTIPESGVIELFTSTGESEIVKYTGRSIGSNNAVEFTLASGSEVENSYASGGLMDCSQEPMAQAALDTQNSDVAHGLFVFNFTAYSRKLHDRAAYSNSKSISIMALELALFRVDSDTNRVVDLERYELETFTIRTGLAETSANPPLTDAEANETVTLVNTLLAAGFTLQFSSDNENWHDTQVTTGETIDAYFRFRSASTGGTWSSAVKLPQGEKGEDGDAGDDGIRGSRVNFGTAVTGTSDTPSVFETGIDDSLEDDLYINTETFGLYQCTLGGDEDTALWAYVGSLKGPKGEDGEDGDDGVRGSRINYGTSITGTSTTPTAYATGLSDSLENDMYLNTSTMNAYQCTLGGNASTALWKYVGTLRGVSAYTYVAYASNSSGSDFSLTPSDSLKYRAEIHTSTPIATPTSSDFSGAVWQKFLGDPGTNGTNGTRGSRFNYGTAVTGTSTTPTSYATGISDSLAGDAYINTSTQALYQCTLGGDASTALWAYVGSLKGDDANAPIDTVQLNGNNLPISSKKVNVMALPMAEDSMPSAESCMQKHLLYLGTTVSADSYVGKLRTYQMQSEGVSESYPYCDLSISNSSATGTSRVWTGYDAIDQQYRITYNNGWVLERLPFDPEDPATQIGTLTTPSAASQPWGAYTITATSATWYFMPVTDAPQATKGHLYERNEVYDESVIFVTINNSTSTLIKVSGTNKWSDDGTDDGDVFVAWNGANGCWEYYSGSAYMSPACQSTVMPWDPSISGQVWTESGDEGTITPIITRCFVGGWNDLGSILGA